MEFSRLTHDKSTLSESEMTFSCSTNGLFAFVFIIIIPTFVVGSIFDGLFSKKVCYGELGCFSTGGDFQDFVNRPLQLLPQNRTMIGTRFFLYNRQLGSDWRELKINDTASLNSSGYHHGKPVRFIVHGLLQSAFVPWMHEMRQEFLAAEDSNVIQVDWRSGAEIPYEQATANTRLVGAEISHLIRFLMRQTTGFRLSDVHLIGHSLGAHICGYAGKYFKNPQIGQIYGLDPAGPAFERTRSAMRIDKDDAALVTVIHTNGGKNIRSPGLGMWEAVGNVDIYLNGGCRQPSCSVFSSISDIFRIRIGNIVACSHMRVLYFFTATIQQSYNTCNYTAYKCSSYEAFKAGSCFDCSQDGACVSAGYKTGQSATISGDRANKYFMKTTGHHPYCGYHYLVNISIATNSLRNTGRLKIQIGNSRNVLYIPAKDKSMTLVPGKNVTGIMLTDRKINNFNELQFFWRKTGLQLLGRRNTEVLKILKITFYKHSMERCREFCSNATLTEGSGHTFSLC